MIKTIILAVVIYLATSIDEVPVLFMLYMDSRKNKTGKTVTFAYFAGTFILVLLGLACAFGLVLVPVKWVVGLIGIIPVVMGVKMFIDGDDDEETMEKYQKFSRLGLKVLAITLALGADDLGVYIPLFSTLNGWEMILMLLVFAVGTAIICGISYRLAEIDRLTAFLEKKERFITGTIFIAIGIFLMVKCNTFSGVIKLLS